MPVETLDLALRMITNEAAHILNLSDYGVAIGNPATFIILDALNAAVAVASPPVDRLLIQQLAAIRVFTGTSEEIIAEPNF